MKKLLLPVLLFTVLPTKAQYNRTADITYKTAKDYCGRSVSLQFDIYSPNGNKKNLPCIFYFHSGSFTGGDKYNKNEKVTEFVDDLVPKGYLFVSVNYRLFKDDPKTDKDNILEVFMATQDANDCIAFVKDQAGEYHVDTAQIFALGTSAGACLALLTGYWDDNEAIAQGIDEKTQGAIHKQNIKAIVSCWGGLIDPAIVNNNKIPVQFFHTTGDPVVPCDHGVGAMGLTIYGSCYLSPLLDSKGVETHLTTWDTNSHGIGLKKLPELIDITYKFIRDHTKQ